MAKNPETRVKFTAFNQDFNKSMKEMEDESRDLNKRFKLQQEQMKDTASDTEKLEHKIENLGQQHSITERKIKATEDALKDNIKYYGENSTEAKKLENKLLDLKISQEKLANASGIAKRDLNKQMQEMKDAKSIANKLKDSLDDVSESAKDMGGKLTGGLSTPLAGGGAAAGAVAVNIDGASRLINGALGSSKEEAKRLKEDLQAVWSDGFGQNPEDAARSMMMVKQNIKGINDGEPLQQITKDAITLANVTDSDVGEVTRSVNQVMHHFGLTAEEALDRFAKGNAEGLNYSQEMFDNISEYSGNFKQMGYGVDEYFKLLANGSKNGAYNLDYINDVVKEFDVRARDGSKKTAEAFAELSQPTQKLFDKFKNGKATTKELFDKVIPELQNMDDQVKANQIGVELFGTKFEDMGAKTVYSLDDTNNAMENTKGAMKELGDTQEESLGNQLQSSLRNLGEVLEPVGKVLVDVLNKATPYIEKFANWFTKLSPQIHMVVAVIATLLTALGPLITVFGFVVQGLKPIISIFKFMFKWVKRLFPIFKHLRTAFMFLTGPVGIVIGIITLLVTVFVTLWNKSDAFRNFFINLWDNIKSFITETLPVIKDFLVNAFKESMSKVKTILKKLHKFITETWDDIKSWTSKAFTSIKDKAVSIWNGLKTKVSGLIKTLVDGAKAIFNGFVSRIKVIFNGVKSFFSTIWSAIKDTIVSLITAISNRAKSIFNAFKSTISNIFNGISNTASSVWGAIKDTVVNLITTLKNKVEEMFNGIKSTAGNIFDGIKNAITNPIETAKDTVLGIIDKIKSGFSNLDLSIPKPKLPHIDVDWRKFGVGNMSVKVPDFDISWYKTGGVFKKPVVAGNAGFGDVEEAIVPFEGSHAKKIAGLIADAQSNMGKGLTDKVQKAYIQLEMNPSDVTLDGRSVGKATWKTVQQEINLNRDIRRR